MLLLVGGGGNFSEEGFCDRVMFLGKDIEGRSLTVQIKLVNTIIDLVNIYAPNEVKDRERFLKGLLGHLTSDNRIVVGDFNVMLSRIDLAQGMVYKADTSRKSLVHLMDEFHYVDFWRCRHGAKRDFSRRQMVEGVLKQSRIDFGLCHVDFIANIGRVFISTIHLVIMLHFTFKFTLRN
ncbi:Transposon TX1 149 kDa protein [Huso huso]|uniref:Transposon TX1 149 kDa protein n=1 Tax=Huso huso TaxID=61971 RepID=A0ABR0Y5B8_HUSHU